MESDDSTGCGGGAKRTRASEDDADYEENVPSWAFDVPFGEEGGDAPAQQFSLVASSSSRYAHDGEAVEGDENGTGEDDALNMEPEVFNPRPPKSRRLELEALGEPDSRSTCWGCVYFGEKDTRIPSDKIRHLIGMAQASYGRIDLVALGQGMEAYYEKEIRAYVNSHLQRGERPLPAWRGATILEHFRDHNDDPLVQQVVQLAEIRELRGELLKCCFEVSNKTNRVRPNKDNLREYREMVKLGWEVQAKQVSKMAFYDAGAHIKPEILSQGILATHGKRLTSYLRDH